MKEINQETFKSMLRKIRLHFGLLFFGASNHMTLNVTVNDKKATPEKLTDEQLVLLWQLINQVMNVLARELIKRELLEKPTSPVTNDKES